MSSYTYVQLYVNELRTVEITIDDEEEAAFVPDTVTCIVESSSGTVVMTSTLAMITSNKVKITIPTTVTSTAGTYNLIWTITKDGMIYKHKTILNVEVIE